MGKRPLITICVGHTAARPGAKAVSPLFIHEYEYNLDLAAIIHKTIFFDFDCEIILRNGLLLDQVYRLIENMKPVGNIELHFNSTNNPMAYGTETLCIDRWLPYASMIQAALCDSLGREGRGNRGVKVLKTKDDRGFGSVSKLNVPNALIEPFFGSSPSDAELGLNSRGKIAEAIHRALQVYFLYDQVDG